MLFCWIDVMPFNWHISRSSPMGAEARFVYLFCFFNNESNASEKARSVNDKPTQEKKTDSTTIKRQLFFSSFPSFCLDNGKTISVSDESKPIADLTMRRARISQITNRNKKPTENDDNATQRWIRCCFRSEIFLIATSNDSNRIESDRAWEKKRDRERFEHRVKLKEDQRKWALTKRMAIN